MNSTKNKIKKSNFSSSFNKEREYTIEEKYKILFGLSLEPNENKIEKEYFDFEETSSESLSNHSGKIEKRIEPKIKKKKKVKFNNTVTIIHVESYKSLNNYGKEKISNNEKKEENCFIY